jgi:hypothetical protein
LLYKKLFYHCQYNNALEHYEVPLVKINHHYEIKYLGKLAYPILLHEIRMTCPCALIGQSGGYRPTRRNRQMLKKYKAGKSIGFTGKASLKAKGMLPRSNGRYILGPKYSGTGKPRVLTKKIQRR